MTNHRVLGNSGIWFMFVLLCGRWLLLLSFHCVRDVGLAKMESSHHSSFHSILSDINLSQTWSMYMTGRAVRLQTVVLPPCRASVRKSCLVCCAHWALSEGQCRCLGALNVCSTPGLEPNSKSILYNTYKTCSKQAANQSTNLRLEQTNELRKK